MKHPVLAIINSGLAKASKPKGETCRQQSKGCYSVHSVDAGKAGNFLAGHLFLKQQMFAGKGADNYENAYEMNVAKKYLRCHTRIFPAIYRIVKLVQYIPVDNTP